MRVTVIFDNLGPYHLARLTAAAATCELTAVELNATSRDYSWHRNVANTAFTRRTLFDSAEDGLDTRQFVAALDAALQTSNPEVVAIPGWSGWHAFAALDWCAVNKVPVIVMSESTAHDEPRTPWKEWIKRQYIGLCSTALVGGTLHAQYLSQLHMPAERIFYGYDVVDNQYFSDESDRVRGAADDWRQRLALPTRYFLASARFIAKKNLVKLLNAYGDYRKNASTAADLHSLWDLVVLGDGERRPDLETARESLGLTHCVHFPGFKQYNELPAYYALAAAFVHTSAVEPWGLVVNEAMAAGLPVLVSNRCGCAPTLIRDGENGWAFDPSDAVAIATCMQEMTRLAPEMRQRMGCRSRQIVAEFGPAKFAEGLAAAATTAMSSQVRRPRLVDRLILRSLLRRSIPKPRRIA